MSLDNVPGCFVVNLFKDFEEDEDGASLCVSLSRHFTFQIKVRPPTEMTGAGLVDNNERTLSESHKIFEYKCYVGQSQLLFATEDSSQKILFGMRK